MHNFMDAMKNPCFFLFILFIYFHLSSGADTISGNQSLSGDQTLVSSGGDFVLGFFRPGNSSNYYLGMWYGKVSTQTVVWVANRENPISDKYSSTLRISNGNLRLFNESQIPVWSTNLNSSNNNQLEATLLDDGNLVLTSSSNSSKFLWQSFDFPAHTWLPGSKLGLNKLTGETQLLISWKNAQDPGLGLFNLELDPDGSSQYFILWNRSIEYWTSGTWNGDIFSKVPEMTANYIYTFSYINTSDESYFTYSVRDPSTISRFVMDVSGQITQLTWLDNSKQWNLFWSQPRQQCQVQAICGAFGTCNDNSELPCTCMTGFEPKIQTNWDLRDYSDGCERKMSLQCDSNASIANGKPDRFLSIPNVRVDLDPETVAAGSETECESNCLSNCSCTAYSYSSSVCSIWKEELIGVTQLDDDANGANGITLNSRLAASEFKSSKSNKGMIIGVIAGCVGAFILGVVFVIVCCLRRRRRMVKAKAVDGTLLSFTYRELQNATKNFSEKLGGGGFGSVFKGVLPDSSIIAVKKLEGISQGEKQFRTEVSTIGTIQHVNLVRLRGFCSDGNKKLLVYDYMPHGSLDSYLFHGKDPKVLDWKTRYQIALGTARGLTYLHEKCRDCIIHCDIKPENILLDFEFCPKVADFGLAKIVGREFSRVLTTMRGTRGYLAPEWLSGVAITAKADVYSYGMMLLELVSGNRNAEESKDGMVKFFPTWAASQIVLGNDVLSLLDSRLKQDADEGEVMRVCKVACWCIQDDETHRPSMGQVVQILEGLLDVNMPPLPRSLQMFVDNPEHVIFFSDTSSSGISLTQSSSSLSSSNAKKTISSTSSTS